MEAEQWLGGPRFGNDISCVPSGLTAGLRWSGLLPAILSWHAVAGRLFGSVRNEESMESERWLPQQIHLGAGRFYGRASNKSATGTEIDIDAVESTSKSAMKNCRSRFWSLVGQRRQFSSGRWVCNSRLKPGAASGAQCRVR